MKTTAVESPIVVMKRYELKYLLDPERTALVRRRIEGHLLPDEYGLSAIASLYYDTPSGLLIRSSLEKPMFKEKLRLRSYGLATPESPVYLELKRKAFDLVYKRRVQTTLPEAEDFLTGEGEPGDGGQISRELSAFREHYGDLMPTCLILYDRTAYFEPQGDLRLTIDEAPRFRTERLDLVSDLDGIRLLPEGWTILEIKVQQAMPLWLTAILSEGGIRKTSFSKYGEVYRRGLLRQA